MADSSSNNPIGSSSGDSANVLKDSPWGRLSEVTSLDNVAQGFASATAGNGGGGSPVGGAGGGASSDAPYGGNPFANFGNPRAEGNVFTGGTNPWASLDNSGSGSQGTGGTTSGSQGTGSTDFASILGGGTTSGSPVSGSSIDFASIFGGGTTSGSPVSGSSIDFASIFGGGTTSGSPVSGVQASGGGSPVSGVQASGGGSPVSGGQASGGGSPVGDGSIDFASIFGGGSGGNVPQKSPFDTLVENLDNYFKPFQEGVTPDPSQFGDPSKLNPFADAIGGSQSSNGSPVGGSSDSLTAGGAGSTGGGSYSDLPSGLQDVFAGLGSGDSQSSNGFDPSQIQALIPQFSGGNPIGGTTSVGGNNPFG